MIVILYFFILDSLDAMKILFFILVMVIGISLASIDTFADNHNIPALSVYTELSTYGYGDTVVISGNISEYDSSSGHGLTCIIISPVDDVVTICQIYPESDGSFQHSFDIDGPLWEISGDYNVEFNYGPISGETTIVYTGGESNEPTPEPEPEPDAYKSNTFGYEINFKNKIYEIDFTTFDVDVKNVEIDSDFISLILQVNVISSSANLEITLDRDFIDSTFEGVDNNFKVTADGDELFFREIATTDKSRTLRIYLAASVEEIEIIGSSFGNSVLVHELLPVPISIPASFVDTSKDPQSYVDRYYTKASYKEWFDENYSEYNSIEQAVGLSDLIIPSDSQIICSQGFEPVNGKCPDRPVIESTSDFDDPNRFLSKHGIAPFVDKSRDPQSYIDRYNNEPEYKEWFHENYPQYDSIEQAVGLELTQKIPVWVKNIFGWYSQDQVSEDELLDVIKYLINKGILVVD